MYGAQTITAIFHVANMFENDVEMYGAQTDEMSNALDVCLRMM